MTPIAVATEDQLSEAIALRLISEVPTPHTVTFKLGNRGNGYLRSRMGSWYQMAQQQVMVLLTDLDRANCLVEFRAQWLASAPPDNLLFRAPTITPAPPATNIAISSHFFLVSSAMAAIAIETCSTVVDWAQRWCWCICSSLLLVPGGGIGFQLFSRQLDLVLFLLVAVHLGLVFGLLGLAGGQVARHLGQRLLGALGLEVVPLVGGFGLLDGGIVLVDAGVGLGGAAHVAEDGAHGGDDGGEHRDLVDHAARLPVPAVAALLGMLEFVVVRAVNVKTVS
jgi:hypothetical protein